MAENETDKTEKVETEATGKDFKEKANQAMDKASEVAGKATEKAGEMFESIADGAKKAGVKAGEVLEDVAEGTKKAAKKAGETAEDVMDNIIVGVRKASEKAADSVKIMEIKHEINKLEGANKKIVPQISTTVLSLYEQGKLKEPELVSLCDEIATNDEMIRAKREKIEEIKNTENK